MGRALQLAREAGIAGDVPVGAVIADATGQFIAQAANRKERDRDPTAHAEIL
ncbi:MAG: tRNA-specific adenosine deaminase, partial [Cyanobacteriota bacterium]|nr:tRNA-specific adenosine deaminase [Cyanobacteriota bacterium]